MSKLIVTERCRRVLSSALSIAVATCAVLWLSAGTASADQDSKISICHKGNTITVDVHAVPAHLEHGDLPVACDDTNLCSCGLNFDPVTCTLPDGSLRTFANRCLAICAGVTEPCPSVGICSNIWDPVTCDGTLYANECSARVAGCLGPYTVLCPCPLIYAPVRCGDGNIYINSCVATCRGQSGCTPLQ